MKHYFDIKSRYLKDMIAKIRSLFYVKEKTMIKKAKGKEIKWKKL